MFLKYTLQSTYTTVGLPLF